LHAVAAGQRSAPELGFDLLQRDGLPRLVPGGVSLGGVPGILGRAQRLNHRLRHDRRDPLAALGDVDDLAAGGLAGRPGHSRAFPDRKLAHARLPSAHQPATRISPAAAQPHAGMIAKPAGSWSLAHHRAMATFSGLGLPAVQDTEARLDAAITHGKKILKKQLRSDEKDLEAALDEAVKESASKESAS